MLGASEQRIGIRLNSPPAGGYSVAFGEDAVFGRGVTLHVADGDTMLWARDYGDLIKRPMNAIGSGAGITVSGVEITDA